MNKFLFSLLGIAAILLIGGNTLTAQSTLATQGNSGPFRQYGPALPRENAGVQAPKTAEDIDKLVPQDKYSLPWVGIRENNILWSERVWRTIDVRDAKNSAFSNSPEIPSGSRLSNMLIHGFFDGRYRAYRDERLGSALTKEEVIALLANKPSAQAGSAAGGFNPDQVSKFLIKEDWMYLDTQRTVVVRIVAIAPVQEVVGVDGTVTNQPMFWLYYPDIRSYLAGHKVYGLTDASVNDWDELFEGRKFSGTIYKVHDRTSYGNHQPQLKDLGNLNIRK